MRSSLFAVSPLSALLLAGLTSPFFASCNADACLSNRDFFEQRLWGPLMSTNCAGCHAPGGAAAVQNAKFLLLPASYPNFLDVNLANLSMVAHLQYNGTSELLLKPLGQMNHGGGAVLSANASTYTDLKTLIQRLDSPPTCAAPSPLETLQNAQILDPAATLRRAAIQFTGKLPDAKLAQSAGGSGDAAEKALRTGVMQLMDDPAFYTQLSTVFNDMLLTDQYVPGTQAIDLLDRDDYPAIAAWFDKASDSDRMLANLAVAREPLQLINYIVQNGLPFTDVVAANYTVVNPWSAKIYGAQVAFADATDPNTFVPATVSLTRANGPVALPHAGVLTMPTFLNRFPTTPTNRNRHRARMVMNMFLATDILSLAQRPIDPSAGASYENPTRDNPACNVCHRIMDPVAGDFQKWDDYNQAFYDPNRVWHSDMAAPGYGTEVMNTADFVHGEQWLAQRIIKDPRFVTATVNTIYKGFIGSPPVAYPTDPTLTSFATQRAAWRMQDALLAQMAKDFVASNYNLKVLIADVITSPLYRTVALPSYVDESTHQHLDPTEIQEVANLGTFRFLTPELLDRKITALTGMTWGGANSPALLNQFRILYGGIDSVAVTSRLSAPNGLMANLAMRMASDISCNSVAQDFVLPAGARRFFPQVELVTMPQTPDGADVPEHVASIRANIAFLHQQLLGESDASEVDQTYQLFFQTWREGFDAVQAGTPNTGLPYDCWATQDAAGNSLPSKQQITQDPNYVIRAWMAVLTYMLSDYRFLHD